MVLWGRRKAKGRKEPRFDFASSLSQLRLTIEDRLLPVFSGDQGTAKPSMSKRKQDDDGDAPEPKPRAEKKKKKGKRSRSARGGLGRLIYWGAVLGLWGVIAVGGVLVWVGAHLPPIQSLEIPKRPPTIQLVGLDGSVLATRGEQAGTNVALKELPPYLPKAFIAIEDRRFYQHFGVDPMGILRALVTN